jgi:hypothetical protein
MAEQNFRLRFKNIEVSKNSVRRAIRVAILVGIILNLINNPQLFSLSFTRLNIYKVLLTFLVPFCVSLYSSILANRSKCHEKETNP